MRSPLSPGPRRAASWRPVWACLLPVLLLLAAARPATAQDATASDTTASDTTASDTTAVVRGVVVDAATHDPLPGASVQVTAAGTQAAGTQAAGTATDVRGRFRLAGLPAGAHTVVVRFLGYGAVARAVTLRAGEAVTLEVVLAPVALGIDEVVVTERAEEAALTEGTRSITTLDAAALDRTRGATLGAMLDGLPGVTTLTTGPSISKPVIRGLHSQRLVLLDGGVRQEGQQWGAEHGPEIDPFAPQRIEVVRGAAGVEHGVGAIGGVIRLKPAPLPTAPGVGGRLSLNAFSNAWQGAGSGTVEGGVRGVDGLGWRVQGSLRRAGDAQAPGDAVLRNTAFFERSGALAVGYQRGRTRVKVRARRFATTLGIFTGAHVGTVDGFARALDPATPRPDYDFSFRIDAPKQRVVHDVVAVEAARRLAPVAEVEARYAVQRNHRQEFDAHCRFCDDPGADPAFDLTLVTHTLDTKLTLTPSRRLAGGDVLATAGLSGMNQGNTNGERGYLIPNFRALTGGAFARGAWSRGAWTLEAGTRLDTRWQRAFPQDPSTGAFAPVVRTFRSLSGVVGALWQLAPAWSLSANASTAWRPPSVNELYSNGVHHGTAQFEIGDPALGAERMLGLDATLRHASARASLEVSAFANRGAGFIHLFPSRDTVVTVRGVFPAFRHQQSDVRLVGVDGAARVWLTDVVGLGLDGSVVRADDLSRDVPLIFMPPDRATLTALLRLPDVAAFRATQVEADVTAVREQTRAPAGADYAPPPPGYALLGLALSTDLARPGADAPVRLSLTVDNLLNTTYRDYLSRYRYFTDAPGRTVALRLAIPF